jgi:hypothetical protein
LAILRNEDIEWRQSMAKPDATPRAPRKTKAEKELSKVVAETEAAAQDAAVEGATTVAEGLDELDAAAIVDGVSAEELALGVSDLTRAVDAAVVADRLSTLSDVMGSAGVVDIAEGAELLASSDDIKSMSAVVGLMSLGDLDRGLELGRMSGELRTISEVVAGLQMPVLAAVLGDRGHQLQRIAADVIVRAAATRSLAQVLAATGVQIGDLGAQEIDEGAMRLAASDIAAERAAELAASSLMLGLRATEELAAADDAAAVARDLAAVGVADVAEGAAELGAAAAVAGVAAAVEESAQ